ncbi:MAG: DUF4249 domain-containing protein [Bacteroidetes bacterium]|nr:DUF4249 domain-containing protein [Bacteroidota bacterium]
MKKRLIVLASSLVFFLSGCKEKYIPPVIDSNLNYLVVDGSLMNGPDSTIIRLGRTKKLDELPVTIKEQNAQMAVEDADGNVLYYFQEINNGTYAVPGMTLDANKKYKLRISTTNGKQYLSDEIIVKESPPIDSVSWRLKEDGVTINVNTHDPSGNTKYYQWQYAETYDYFAGNYSLIKYDPSASSTDFNQMFPLRSGDELVYHCWRTVLSSQILIGSSLNLTEDRINMAPVRFIPKTSVEINATYSILVKQYALTKEAFEYLENIKKISEQTGSLFDAQPSQLPGNIRCVSNPEEPVIGYVIASSMQQKRIFITNNEVFPWGYFEYCPPKQTIPLILDSIKYYFDGLSPRLVPIEKTTPLFTGIIAALPSCTDCTTKGGTNVKPDFWP